MRFILILYIVLPILTELHAQPAPTLLLKPSAIFDGHEIKRGNLGVLVEGQWIRSVGPLDEIEVPSDTRELDLTGLMLMPGLIEGHGHILLHPYDETPWNDQVLKESEALRVARAVRHLENTLLAGVTTLRDLGTEGAGYADVGLKQAVEQGIIAGPRLLVATRAIVSTGSYGPKGFSPAFDVLLGAETADGNDELIRVVRDQIGKGADVIKVYADYRWGPDGEAMPTFTLEELKLIVDVASSSGRPVSAHAATPEGMRRAILAGVDTIEHGDGGTQEIYELMAEQGVVLCPTLAAGEAVVEYAGWIKGQHEAPERIRTKRESFQRALEAGVPMCAGGDVGVYSHGDNAREFELMVDYGMRPMDVLRAATANNARYFHLENDVGSIKEGLLADLIAVEGDPTSDISALRNIKFIMLDGKVIVNK